MDKEEWLFGMQFQAAGAVLNQHGVLTNMLDEKMRRDCCLSGTWRVVRQPVVALDLIAKHGLEKEYEAMLAKMKEHFNPNALRASREQVRQLKIKSLLKDGRN
jgi:hypothetical protein